jgi:glycosyltransferase involved in cell wall biosynthesis
MIPDSKLRVALEGLGATVGPIDGAARYLGGLALGLSQQADVRLLLLHGPSLAKSISFPAHVATTTIGGSGRPRRLLAQHVSVPRQTSTWGAHAVIYTGNYCPMRPGPPDIVVVQNMFLLEDTAGTGRAVSAYRRWQARRIARHATRVVAVSHFMADALVARFPQVASRLSVVTPGVDEHFFTGNGNADVAERWRDRPYFLCVGTARRYRDYELAISALGESRLDHDLVIAGPASAPDKERLLRHAEGCMRRGRLILAGSLARDQMYHAYRDATALVATSRIESFALSVLEAMAVGTPVVAVRRTVYPETVGTAGMLCEPVAAGLAEALRSTTEDDTHRELVAKGKVRASEARWSESASMIRALAYQLREEVEI